MKKYDLIVAGGGSAGVAAAVAAARNGSTVLLIEQSGYLGGMATNGAVPAFCPYTDGEKVIVGGLGMEILERLKEISYVSPFYDDKEDRQEGFDWVPIDPEALKQVLDQLIYDSGCEVLFHTTITDAVCENGYINAVNVYNNGMNQQIKADFFADCTGDANLTALAGGDFEYGDSDGLVQASTLCFRIANFDHDEFMEYANLTGEDGNLNVASRKAIASGDFPLGEKNVAGIALQTEGMAGLNFGHVYGFNPLIAEELTKAEIESRKRLPELMGFLRKYVPGAEHAVLASSGPHIGLRESRRIMGEYQLTEEDYYNRRDFEDAIGYYSYPIDMHASKLEDTLDSEKNNKVYALSKYKNGESYGIPYGSLLPKKIKNLIVAGRIISADRAMMASVRVMPACFITGQAAGTAVAICAANKKSLQSIDIKQLQKVLKEQGVYLKEKDHA